MSLVNLALLGNFKEFKALAEENKERINEADESGDTPLHAAASKGRAGLIKYLLTNGANVNALNKVGSTPLHKAAAANGVDLGDAISSVSHLLKHGADINIRNGMGLLADDITRSIKIKELIIGDDLVTEEVFVQKENHKHVIGRGGKKLNELILETGALISVPREGDAKTTITVKGRSAAVAVAKEKILDMTKAKQAVPPQGLSMYDDDRAVFDRSHGRASANGDTRGDEEGDEAQVTVSIPLSKDKHRLVIGRGGSTLRRLREDFGVQVFVPSPEDSDKNIVLKGAQEDVDDAIREIKRAIDPPPAAATGGPGGRRDRGPPRNGGGGGGGGGSGDGNRRGAGAGGGGSGGRPPRNAGGGGGAGSSEKGKERRPPRKPQAAAAEEP